MSKLGGYWENPDGGKSYSENAYWNKKYMIEQKNKLCMDCGLRWHPVVMTFDHKNRDSKYVSGTGKRMSPNKMLTYNPTDFRNMIDSLDAVCMNCHRIREELRDNNLNSVWWKNYTKQLTKGALL